MRSSTHVSTRSRPSLAGPVIAVIAGIVLVLLAQFVFDGLADTSDAWHNIQHGAFFVGGIAVGAGGARIRASGRLA